MNITNLDEIVAQRRVELFERQHGKLATLFASHAALPVAFNSSFVHLLRINFFIDPPEELSSSAEAEFLLSSLCREIGEDLYEIDATIRNLLLKRLFDNYTIKRLRDVAQFLWEYTEEMKPSPWGDFPRLERAQKLTVLNFLDPNKASEWLVKAEEGVLQGAHDEDDWVATMRVALEETVSFQPESLITGILSGIFSSIADAVILYVVENFNLIETLKTWLMREPARLAFQKTLARTYAAFARQYPEYTASLFDETFLVREAVPELSRLLIRAQHPDPALLAQAWGEALGAGAEFSRRATKPASDFLFWLEAELKDEQVLQPLFDSRALETIPKLEVEIQKLVIHLQHKLNVALKAANNYQKIILTISGNVKDSNIISNYYSGDFVSLNEYYIPPDEVFQRVRVDEFVGRDWLTAKVDTFLNDPSQKSGAFLLVGDAGVGKTAFMAHLVKERRYLHLFAEQVPGQAMLQRALQSLGSQLVTRYQIDPYKDRDTLNVFAGFPDFLERLLRLAASTLTEGEKIVIVCDALDEAGVFPGHFVFGLPKELPDGVYLILSQRHVNTKLPNFEPLRFDLVAQGEDNLQDMEDYLSAVAKRPAVAGQIRAKDYSEDFFIQTLKEKSLGVWMYLHYIVKEIEDGVRAPLALENLPKGLVGYYADYWDDWRHGRKGRGKGEEAWNTLYAPLLTMLAVVEEAITIEQLIQWTDVKASPREVAHLLRDEWRSFVTEKEVGEAKTYMLYHPSFRNFITGRVDFEKLDTQRANLVRDLSEQTEKARQKYSRAAQITLNEAKLILVGEGEVGKTCLRDALLGDVWQEHPSTHGIEIKPIKLTNPDTQIEITLNSWDFGGQRVYRPTHQLFFSGPAVYLVVWKPREGSQQGFVKEWIKLVKHREPDAKILVVATHGGPQQSQPDIDRIELWDLFGKDTVVDFFFVDCKPDAQGNRKGIEELKRAIAKVAASLPEVGRSVPKSFADVRQALQDKGSPYLPLREVLDICRAHNMDDEIARLFITISHRLGYLMHYQHDPVLHDIVILRPDWLATAISYVFDDEVTRASHGFVRFSRLNHLWDDPTRTVDTRYPANLHPIFLRLMERFDLAYRVATPYSKNDSDPMSLISQLVPDIRPQNFSDAWKTSPASGDIQQTQICHILDTGNGQSDSAEGLFYQLIVRLHKYSLGRADYNASVHWQRGLVLEDEFKSRAFLEHVGNDVRITVRSPYPEGMLGMLTREVKFLVESFWEGLRCDVMVPCIEPCGKHAPGTGLFEVEKLMDSKRKNRNEFPCPVCNEWQNIDSLLRNASAATQQISLVELQSEFAAIKDKLDEVNVTSRRILSQVDKTYTDLLQVLTDEGKEGPRLFSFFPVDRRTFNSQTWIREKFRLVLWCEHSRLPLPVLNNGDMKKGVYDLELEREWFKKANPYLKFMTGTLSMVLPVAASAVKLALDETAYKLIEEQLDFCKSILDMPHDETSKIGDFLGAGNTPTDSGDVALRDYESPLRELHALLKTKYPSFGGLVRVMNKRQEFLWVHEKFVGEY